MRLHVFNIPLTPEGLGRGVEEANRFLDRIDVKNISAQLVEDKYRGAFWSVLVTYETKTSRVEFRESNAVEAKKATAQPATNNSTVLTQSNAPVLDKEGQELYEKLRTWRNTEARTHDVPGYSILTNRQLQKVSQARPTTVELLKQETDITEQSLEKYGEIVLAIIRGEEIPQSGISSEPEPEVMSPEQPTTLTDTVLDDNSPQTA